MAEKEYLAGEHYFNRRALDSAIIYYQVARRANSPVRRVGAARSAAHVQAYERLGYEQEATAARTAC
jgi:outer membrane protein assembly factor BamD (BamD/ComL family)